MYKIKNTISAIQLHEQKLAKSSFAEPGMVKLTGIILQKPFKLQILAVAKVSGKNKKRLRSIEYNGTLKEAVTDAVAKRTQWMKELKSEIEENKPREVKAVTKMLTLSEAFDKYCEYQKIMKGEAFDSYRQEKLFEKHIKPTLGNVNMDDIDAEDIKAITNKMTVSRAKLDKDGNKIPHKDPYVVAKGKHKGKAINKTRWVMEERPAAERTKRTIYQLINPIYTYVNSSNKIKFTVPSPASMASFEPLENEKEVKVQIDSFTTLYNYDDPRYKNFFIWLMHGRRFGEVASLRYDDIDLESGTYTIQKHNNKARKAMTYVLTQWQRETLPESFPEDNRLVFPSVNNMEKQIYSATVQSHFALNCTMHDLRHVLGNALINVGVSTEIIGRILGHKPAKNVITNRYAKVSAEVANDALVKVLEGVLV